MLNTFASGARKMRKASVRILLTTAIVLAAPIRPASAGDVLAELRQQPAFSMFVDLLQSSGLEDDLQSNTTFTIFAPSNAAFDALTPEMRSALTREKDPSVVRQRIQGLIISSKWAPQALAQKRTLIQAMNGRMVLIDGTQGRLTAGDAEVLSVDVAPSNGVIYEIDSVDLDP